MKRTALLAALLLGLGQMPDAHSDAKISDDTVRIGLIIDLTGTYADLAGQGSIVAARMAIDDVGGKVLGKPVELITSDSQNKADVAATRAREWFDTQKVDAILDVVPTNSALAVLGVAAEKNRIVAVVGSASTPITNDKCIATGIHWMYDTYSSSVGVGKALVSKGLDSWFFLTADYAFGKAMQEDVTAMLESEKARVIGSIRHPLNTADFSSFLLQAQQSGAKVVALANAGTDAVNSVKQASEFGLTGKQVVAPMLLMLSEVHSLGLKAAQNLYLSEGFYWDRDDASRQFSKRFHDKHKRMPTMAQAGVYSAVTHYLKAVQATGTDATDPVMKAMRETPVSDPVIPKGTIRADGRLVHDMLLVQVKKPEESKGPWDYYHVRGVIPGDEAFKPLSKSTCPLIRKSAAGG